MRLNSKFLYLVLGLTAGIILHYTYVQMKVFYISEDAFAATRRLNNLRVSLYYKYSDNGISPPRHFFVNEAKRLGIDPNLIKYSIDENGMILAYKFDESRVVLDVEGDLIHGVIVNNE